MQKLEQFVWLRTVAPKSICKAIISKVYNVYK